MEGIMARGAEAVLRREGDIVVKDRISKGYRLPVLDERIRKLRTRGEARLLDAAARAGMDVPRVLSSEGSVLRMGFIEGERVKDALDGMKEGERDEVCSLIGEAAGRLHSAGIVHGDLTTSNMIYSGGRIFLVDFGLGKFSAKPEDQATDLYLLYEAMKSAHFKYLSRSWQYILKSYGNNHKGFESVLARLEKIGKRRRYKGG